MKWQALITADEPGKRIAWASLPGVAVRNHGAVTFTEAPRGQGTQVHLVLSYEPIAGALGRGFASLFGAVPLEKMRNDLRRFKQIMETGNVMVSDASVHTGPHAARPSSDAAELAQKVLTPELHSSAAALATAQGALTEQDTLAEKHDERGGVR